jgi:hypothetical protein
LPVIFTYSHSSGKTKPKIHHGETEEDREEENVAAFSFGSTRAKNAATPFPGGGADEKTFNCAKHSWSRLLALSQVKELLSIFPHGRGSAIF